MIEIFGNFWDHSKDFKALCVTTNGVVKWGGRLVMGAGIAKDFRDKFLDLDLEFGALVKKSGNRVNAVSRNGRWVIAVPTKNHWKDPSSLSLIESSCKQLKDFVDSKPEIERVLMTRLGTMNGGLDWSVVKPIMEASLDDRFTVIERIQNDL